MQCFVNWLKSLQDTSRLVVLETGCPVMPD